MVKVTKKLAGVIVTQFRGGDDIDYLSGLYGITKERVIQEIRRSLNLAFEAAAAQAAMNFETKKGGDPIGVERNTVKSGRAIDDSGD